MTSDILNSIKATLYDRISNPLVGAFFVSWIIWNYKFVWVLFSASTFAEKFQYIDVELYPTVIHMLGYILLAPAVFTYLYLYQLPKLSHIVYEHYQIKQKELKEIKQKIEDETPLTKEESRKLRTEIRMLEVKHQEEMDARKQKYDDQDVEVMRMTSEIDQLRNNLADIENKNKIKISDAEEAMAALKNENAKLMIEAGRAEDPNSTNEELKKMEHDYLKHDEPFDEGDEGVVQQEDDGAKYLKSKYTLSNMSGLSQEHIDVIKALAEMGGAAQPSVLMDKLGVNEIKFDVLISDMIDGKALERRGNLHEIEDDISLSIEGKRYALNHGFIE